MQKMTELEIELISRLELADEYIEALLADNKKFDNEIGKLTDEKAVLFTESANKDSIIEKLNKEIEELKEKTPESCTMPFVSGAYQYKPEPTDEESENPEDWYTGDFHRTVGFRVPMKDVVDREEIEREETEFLNKELADLMAETIEKAIVTIKKTTIFDTNYALQKFARNIHTAIFDNDFSEYETKEEKERKEEEEHE